MHTTIANAIVTASNTQCIRMLMILAVLSFLLRPLNATSSVLLKKHSLFLTSEFNLPVLLYASLASMENYSNGTIGGLSPDLSYIFSRHFLCCLNASGPAARKRLTYFIIILVLVIASYMAKSWYEISLDKYNSTIKSFVRKNIST